MEQSPKDYIKKMLLREIASFPHQRPGEVFAEVVTIAPVALVQRCLLELLAAERVTLTDGLLTVGPRVSP